MTVALSVSVIHKAMKVLSKELQSLLTAILSLLSIYIIGVLVIFVILTKVSQISCISYSCGLEYYKEITSISPHTGGLSLINIFLCICRKYHLQMRSVEESIHFHH